MVLGSTAVVLSGTRAGLADLSSEPGTLGNGGSASYGADGLGLGLLRQ